MKVLVDEMYPATVAEALRASGMGATTVADLRLGGAPDAEIFGAAVAGGFCVLTENVGDFARIAAEHSTSGGHHAGVLVALSSRFSRRPAGLQRLVDAIWAVADEQIGDRVDLPQAGGAVVIAALLSRATQVSSSGRSARRTREAGPSAQLSLHGRGVCFLVAEVLIHEDEPQRIGIRRKRRCT